MAKKKKNTINKSLFSIIAAVLGVVAVAMLFLAAVKVPDTTILGATIEGECLTGLQVAFGYSEENIQCLSFSFMALLPWVLILLGIVASLLTSSKKGSKLLAIVSTVLFAAAAVLLFLMPGFMVFAESLAGIALKAFTWKLGIGAIIAGICSALASVVALVRAL